MIPRNILHKTVLALLLTALMLISFFTSHSLATTSGEVSIRLTISEKLIAIMDPIETITMTTTDHTNLEVISTIGLTVQANIPWNLYLELRTDDLRAASQALFEARIGYKEFQWVNLAPNGRSLLIQDHAIGVSTLDVYLKITAKNVIAEPFSITPIVTVTAP